jgi:cell division protein FtsW
MFRTVGERTVKSSSRSPDARTTRRREQTERRYEAMSNIGVGHFNAAPSHPLNNNRAPAAVSKGGSKAIHFRIDIPLALAIITLSIFGLIMVYSASYDYSFHWYDDPNMMFRRQLIWFGLGVGIATALVFVDYHRWRQVAVPIMGATILLLVGVLVVNEVINSASRTIYRGSVQPSEMAKLVTIIYLSIWLHARREQLHDLGFGLLPLAGILGILGGLIVLQPDLSAVITIFILGGLMFFLAGGDLRQIAFLLLVALLIGFIIVQFSPTGSSRIQDYLAGLKDPTNGAYQVRRAFEAFVRGGWFGAGIGRAETKLTGLPVPPTDSIFAVVGEETGVVGATFLIALYVILLWRGLKIALGAPDEMGALLAVGLTLWLALEAFINMAVMVNLLPFAGNALPFISAGGSNLVMSLAAIGILLNISRLSEKRKEENGKYFYAVTHLRGRDRGRRVSGSDRVASVASRKPGGRG